MEHCRTGSEIRSRSIRFRQSPAERQWRFLVTEFLATLPVVGLNVPAALEFGRHKAMLERAGRRVADADLLICAIALAHCASVVTGNRKHYERIEGLRTEDWIRG